MSFKNLVHEDKLAADLLAIKDTGINSIPTVDIFSKRMQLISIKSLFTLDGIPIENFPGIIPGSTQNCVPFKSGHIFVLKNNPNEYRLISGMQDLCSILENESKLIPVVVYPVYDNRFDEVVDALIKIQELGDVLHFFDFSELLGTIIKYTKISQKELAAWLNVSQPGIGNKLRLLKLSPEVRKAAIFARLTERHCRSILTLESETAQLMAIEFIIKYHTSSKKTEQVAKNMKSQHIDDIGEDRYIHNLDRYFQCSAIAMADEIDSFLENLQRETRMLKSLGVNVSYAQRERALHWEIQICVNKLTA